MNDCWAVAKESWDYIPRLFLHIRRIHMTDIPFSSIDDQIKKLLSQNLIINDIDYAKFKLELFGYLRTERAAVTLVGDVGMNNKFMV